MVGAKLAPAGATAAGAAAITRAQIVAMPGQGRTYEFVPLALETLSANPGDAGVRLLLAATYTRLGLRTAAHEQLTLLDGVTAGADPNARTLREAAGRLGEDGISLETRIANVKLNVAALARRGAAIPDAAIAAWCGATAEQAWFRAGDGNIVRRPVARASGAAQAAGPGTPGVPAWTRFEDEVGVVRRLSLPPAPAAGGAKPFYVEGLDPAWLLRRVCGAYPRQADGSWARVVVVDEDWTAVLDALAAGDLREIIEQERTAFFLGPGAGEAFAANLTARITYLIAGFSARSSATRGTAVAGGRGVHEIMSGVCEAQQRLATGYAARVASAYAPRDAAYWAKRYAAVLNARAGGTAAEPLRVLIPTTRFSTFIQHSSRDLAAALAAAGCEARVLMEPDDHTQMTTVATSRVLSEFDPDLILLINYPRRHMASCVPANVPFVCWAQDAMGHLFDPKMWTGSGALDYLVGLLFGNLPDRVGLPRAQTLALPVLASATKFHPGPIDAALLERHACEIACVTHHSQTPEQYKAHLLSQSGGHAPTQRVVEGVFAHVRAWVDTVMDDQFIPRARAEIGRLLAHNGLAGDAAAVTNALNQIAMPLADRFIRHQTLEWAAEVCRKRSWRLHLYGRGWEKHPTLARHARGVIPHGEELRAAYAAAGVHLHASVNWLLHQRVMECALSGGLPLARRKFDDLCLLDAWASNNVALKSAPAFTTLEPRITYTYAADRWESMMMLAQLQRLGKAESFYQDDRPMVPGRWLHHEVFRNDPWGFWGGKEMPASTAWLMGDLAESTFASPEELERHVEAALTRPAWKASLSGGIAARVRDSLTYERAVTSIIEMIAATTAAASNTRANASREHP